MTKIWKKTTISFSREHEHFSLSTRLDKKRRTMIWWEHLRVWQLLA